MSGRDRKPVPRAIVSLVGERASLATVTDDAGRFAFPRVPFGLYVLSAVTPDGAANSTVDVATDSILDVALVPQRIIGRTGATATSVRGTPVSENTFDARRLAQLPRNDRLDSVVEQVPGVVRFSYGEPVAHGFHGITYELDGAPLPQSTSSNFGQMVDPRDAAAVEVFTGAFPAEFGGSRQGAIVNIISGGRDTARTGSALTFGGGTDGAAEVRLAQRRQVGRGELSLAFNSERTNRGLDTPTRDALHDASAASNAFLRYALPLTPRDLVAVDISSQYASFRIPTNPAFSPTAPIVSAPGTDDVQREYDRFASLSYTHTSKDGNGYFRVVPWYRWGRVAYDGDLANDVQGVLVKDDGTNTSQNGLRQDRVASYAGVRAAVFRAGAMHAFKAGLDVSREDFRSTLLIRFAADPDFTDSGGQRGTQTGLYVQDKWSPTPRLTVNAGLRYDHSTGYVGGSQLSPRFEVNAEVARGTVLHAYVGRLFAAPALEDTRRDAVVTQTSPINAPVYDLRPERDTYLEFGLARTFAPGVRAYVNVFDRTSVNVLDTTQLANTPLFAVFNNAIGRDRGVEFRFDRSSAKTDAGVSLTYSRAEAGGVSGGTFLFAPDAAGDLTWQPEDHDQAWSGNAFVTRRFGADGRTFATLQGEYGTGFPVTFQSGQGRLPAHSLLNVSVGRSPSRGVASLGYTLSIENALDHRFLIKVNNGFNTTQWNAPRRIVLRVTAPW